MSKIVLRCFFDILDGQKKWLNIMSEQGYRLEKCGRIIYTFEKCQPGEFEYAVEYVGSNARSKAIDYQTYLESMGYQAFTQRINLNRSYGKLRWRPYAKGMGQIATSPGGYNKELLVLEKKQDGTPFELHTDVNDKLDVYKTVRRTYIWGLLVLLPLLLVTFIPGVVSLPLTAAWILRTVILAIVILLFVTVVKYFAFVAQLKDESNIYE